MFDHRQFSRSMKVALGSWLSGAAVKIEELEKQVSDLRGFDLDSLLNDDNKKAFWINVYNGLTNYFIISHQLKKSVWEVENFFSALKVNIGGNDFSLDDIEHGILRKNGDRKKGKALQFEQGNAKLKLMVQQLDPRIHFALNCGSVSCPPISFYSAENIDQQLNLAEESFASQEFKVDASQKQIKCSEIFIWYRQDFGPRYLNHPGFDGYAIEAFPYHWKLR